MRRILMINDEMTIGGVENVLINILNNMDYEKYSVDLLLDYKNNNDSLITEKTSNVFYVYGERSTITQSRIKRYVQQILKELFPVKAKGIIKKGKYDCVIDFKGADLSYLRGLSCPTVFWNHKDFSVETNPYERRFVNEYGKTPMGKFKLHFLKKNIAGCNYIVCISDTMKKHFIERFGYKEKIHVIYNAMDVESIKKKALAPIDDLGNKKKFTFVCVSRITEGKGLERLLHSVRRLNENGYEFSLIIVGDGDKFDEITTLAKDFLLDNVIFTGRKNNPFPYYNYANVIVMPSENEAATLIVPEAMILEKALIATDVGSTAEMLSDSKYGMLVPSSEDGIYEGMKKILDEPELQKKYEKANVDAENRFGIHHTMERIEEFIDMISQ